MISILLNDGMHFVSQILGAFNNRELATIFWLFVFVLWLIIYHAKTLTGFKNVLYSAAKLWPIFLSMFVYISLSIFFLYKLSWWNVHLLKITVFWFFGWSIVTMMSANDTRKDGYYKKLILGIVGVTAVISFLTNFYSFPFFVELLLVPFITVVAMLTALPKTKENTQAMRLLDWILISFGLTVLLVNAIRAIREFDMFATIETLQEFSLPIILSLMFLPYVYLLSLFFKYEQYRFRKKYLNKT